MPKRKDSFTFKREKLFLFGIQERIYPLPYISTTLQSMAPANPTHNFGRILIETSV
jgi:hypothetical protein